jgi:hypothetical protein
VAADESLRTVLLGATSVTDVVGSTGVYLDDAGQSNLSSYIIISQQGHNPHGTITETTGIGETTFDIDCFSKTRTQARVLADAVSVRLKDYSGVSGSTTFGAVNWVDEGSDVVTAADGSTVHYYVLTHTYNIFWSE